MTYILENEESTYIFPSVGGGSSNAAAFTGAGWAYHTGWSSIGIDESFTTIYVMINSGSGNSGEIYVPYAATQGNNYHAPPANITRMILHRNGSTNIRKLRMVGGYSFKINGTSFASSAYYVGFDLGTDGETIVFERNEDDIANNNWRVYSI